MRPRTLSLPPGGSARLVLCGAGCAAGHPPQSGRGVFVPAVGASHNRRTQDPEFARLTFCLLGVATPSDLIQDTRTTPFNIGTRIDLTDFTAAEAGPLAEGLGIKESGGELAGVRMPSAADDTPGDTAAPSQADGIRTPARRATL